MTPMRVHQLGAKACSARRAMHKRLATIEYTGWLRQ